MMMFYEYIVLVVPVMYYIATGIADNVAVNVSFDF